MTWKQIRKKYKVNRWRVVEGFEDYRVTDDGRLWSCRLGAFVVFHPNKNFYIRVELWKDGCRERPFIHRLVAKYFCKNSQPRKRDQVNHVDFNKENNHYKNLQWCTRSENMLHNRNKWKYTEEEKKAAAKDWKKLIADHLKKEDTRVAPEPQPVIFFPATISLGPTYNGDEPPF